MDKGSKAKKHRREQAFSEEKKASDKIMRKGVKGFRTIGHRLSNKIGEHCQPDEKNGYKKPTEKNPDPDILPPFAEIFRL
ncbi:MAG TPA: hypothetical protein VFV38_15340 [Ktedonobacteraceae bacterium]|nr:hypothetical protein [Ktedonobacteraceae bacterium]